MSRDITPVRHPSSRPGNSVAHVSGYVTSRPDGLGEVPGQRLPVCRRGVDAESPSPGCEAWERHELPAGEAGQLQWLVGASGGDRRGAGGGDGLLLARRSQEREVNRTVAWPWLHQVRLEAAVVAQLDRVQSGSAWLPGDGDVLGRQLGAEPQRDVDRGRCLLDYDVDVPLAVDGKVGALPGPCAAGAPHEVEAGGHGRVGR